MSSEGKKKRGASGLSNAQNSPLRLNGRPPDWQARSMGCHVSGAAKSGGSVTMRGILGGVIAAKLGFPMYGDYERLMSHALTRVTHPYLMGDD